MARYNKNNEQPLDEILEKEMAEMKESNKVEEKAPEKPEKPVKKVKPASGTAKVW